VLDFGLAKALEGESAPKDASLSPTLTNAATRAGIILGTAAYMAPEQARGKTIDKRADIWAFGCVVYEMLTARRVFESDEVSDTLAAILTKEPDWNRLPADTPPSIAKLLRRCLEKDRKHRLADAADAQLEIDEALNPPAASVTGLTALDHRSVSRRAAVWTAGTLVIVAVAATAIWLGRQPGAPRMVRFTIASSGPTAVSINGNDRDLVITPDGTRAIYVGNNGTQLLVRAFDQLEPTVIASSTGLRAVFVAPDGRWVGFEDRGILKKVAITGGPSVPLTTLTNNSRGAAWTPDESIIFASGHPATGLHRVPAGGGDAIVLTRPDRARGEADHIWPEMLPGGRAVLFTIAALTGLDDAQVAVLDLTTGAPPRSLGAHSCGSIGRDRSSRSRCRHVPTLIRGCRRTAPVSPYTFPTGSLTFTYGISHDRS
jgi:Protein kinase domain